MSSLIKSVSNSKNLNNKVNFNNGFINQDNLTKLIKTPSTTISIKNKNRFLSSINYSINNKLYQSLYDNKNKLKINIKLYENSNNNTKKNIDIYNSNNLLLSSNIKNNKSNIIKPFSYMNKSENKKENIN